MQTHLHSCTWIIKHDCVSENNQWPCGMKMSEGEFTEQEGPRFFRAERIDMMLATYKESSIEESRISEVWARAEPQGLIPYLCCGDKGRKISQFRLSGGRIWQRASRCKLKATFGWYQRFRFSQLGHNGHRPFNQPSKNQTFGTSKHLPHSGGKDVDICRGPFCWGQSENDV